MTSELSVDDRAVDEATQWFARLNTTHVAYQTLIDFHAWRRDPANDRAYRKIENLWSKSTVLRSDPAMQVEVDAALERAKQKAKEAKSRWRLAVGGAAGVGCACLVLASAALLSQSERYSTGVGEQRTIRLGDGSQVKLDTNSQIAVRFGKGLRSVTLVRGQAFFDVVHRADQPFQVIAGDTLIRDLGTRFDVRRVDDRAQVTLVEGAVTVLDHDARRPAWTLKAGQQIASGPLAAPRVVDAAVATSWTTGRLIFNDAPLADAVAEVNRYTQHKVGLATPEVGAIRISGTFDNNKTDDFVSAVVKLYDLSARRQTDGGVVLSASNPQPAS